MLESVRIIKILNKLKKLKTSFQNQYISDKTKLICHI